MEENKAMVRRLMEESLGGGKPELVDELLDKVFLEPKAGSMPGSCVHWLAVQTLWQHGPLGGRGAVGRERPVGRIILVRRRRG